MTTPDVYTAAARRGYMQRLTRRLNQLLARQGQPELTLASDLLARPLCRECHRSEAMSGQARCFTCAVEAGLQADGLASSPRRSRR